MFWAVLCWETLDPAIYVTVGFICTTSLNIDAEQEQKSPQRPHHLQYLKDMLLRSCCHIPQHPFRDLVDSVFLQVDMCFCVCALP